MVAGFRRSISLPGHKDGAAAAKVFPQTAKPPPERSASLPCHAHRPAVARLEAEFVVAAASRPSSEDLPARLAHLDSLHQALAEFLRLPQTQDSLRCGGATGPAHYLLDDLLVFADALGSFRLTLVALRQLQAEVLTALRWCRDAEFIATLAQSLRRVEKELAATAAALEKVQPKPILLDSGLELAAMVGEARAVMAAVFRSMAAVVALAAAVVGCKSSSWRSLKRKLPPKDASVKGGDVAVLVMLGECLVALESPADKTFRSVVNARVAVLNILTPTYNSTPSWTRIPYKLCGFFNLI
ncbi:uncharacterized protein LOC144715272 [Wolffia australiana]